MKRRIPIVLPACLAAGCGGDTRTSPTPIVTHGSICQLPDKRWLAGASVFTFTATGFTISAGQPFSCAWDLCDRTAADGRDVNSDPASASSWPSSGVSRRRPACENGA